MAGELEDIEMTEAARYPVYDDMDEAKLENELGRLRNEMDINDPETQRRFNYVEDLLGRGQGETSFIDNDGGKTVTIRNRNNTEVTFPRLEFIDSRRPENLPIPAVERFISRGFGIRDFKLNYSSDKTIELRSRLSLSSNNNIEFKPLTTSNERGKPQIVLKRKGGFLRYNNAEIARKAVRQFRVLVKEVVNDQRSTPAEQPDEKFPLIKTNVERPVIDGLTSEENRELVGVLNPSDTIDPGSRIGQNGALQIQADHFQETLNRTIEQRDEVGDALEFDDFETRIFGLEEARDRTLEQRELEETREQQEQDISRYQRFKEFAKENMVGLSAVGISIAGIITTIIVSARKAILQGAQATSKFAKALYNLGKKLGPLLAPLLTIMSYAVSFGAKGLAWLASNLWVLVIAITWFVYNQYIRKET